MKNLRRIALIRIRNDPLLSRQHWTASGGWPRRILRAIGPYFILPVSAIVIAALIAFLGAVFAGGQNPDPAGAHYVVFAGAAVFVAFSHAVWVLRELIGSRSLAVVSVLPDSDEDYAANRLRLSLKKTLPFFAGSLFLGAGIAFGEELNVFNTIQVLLLAGLLWAMVASLSVIIPAFFPLVVRQEVIASIVGLILMLIFSAAALIGFGLAQRESLIFATLITLPTGWPLLLIKYGVILKQPEAWWLLLPAACVVTLAVAGYSRLLSRYRIQEFEYEPGSLATAEFRSLPERDAVIKQSRVDPVVPPLNNAAQQPQHTDPAIQHPGHKQRLINWLTLSDPTASSEELTRDQAIARIRGTQLTKRFDWSEAGFVERTLAGVLRDDELLSADILSVNRPRWSWMMARSLIPATAAVIIIVGIAFMLHRQIAVMSGHLGIAGVAGTLIGGRWAGLWRSTSGDTCAAMALLPIDGRHVSRMAMTLGAIRSVLIFPFAAGVILALEWGHRGQLGFAESALFGAKVTLIVAALHQWWFALMQPFSCPQSIRKTILNIVVVFVVAGTLIAGLCVLLMSGRSEIWTLVGAGLLFGTGWVAQRLHNRAVLHLPTDFVIHRPAPMAAVQRQQKHDQTRKGPSFWPRPIEQPEPSL